MDGCSLPDGSQDPLEEQQVLLIAEPSLAHPTPHFNFLSVNIFASERK